MKVCEFCGTQCANSVTVCKSCQGNSFHYICPNCGTEIKEGAYCSICGVKAGQQAKKCPKCGTQFFSNACPNCGYSSIYNDHSNQNSNTEPPKRKHTFWWVMGWIFIFPIPLTVLMVRKKDWNRFLRAGVIVAAWAMYLLIAVNGDTGEESAQIEPSVTEAPAAVETVTDDEADEAEIQTEAPPEEGAEDAQENAKADVSKPITVAP